jgi:8-oxo-dGTP diphosphatase
MIELCVGAVVVDDGRLLLVRRGRGRSAGTWSIPGGHVEVGETMAEAVLRELHEETGLVGVCDDLIGWVEHINDDGHLVIFDFGVTVLDSAEPVAGDDATEAAWVPGVEAEALPLAEGLLEFLYANGILGPG